MDKEFVVIVTGLYRKFKDKDRSVVTFRHFLAALALRYLHDAKGLPNAPVAPPDLPRELAPLFRHTPPAPAAPVLDGLVGQLAGHPAVKNIFAEVSFARWAGKDDPQRPARLAGLVSELGLFSFGADAAEIARNGQAVGYLLEKFAEENFHKHGFLYTPKSLATLMVRLVNPSAGHTVYDPACGLGNLLVQAARATAVPAGALYGAEPDDNYRGLAHFNLFFSGLSGAQVSGKDTLAEARKSRRPAETYDCVLLHPPFGDLPLLPAQPEGLPFLFNGAAPAKNGKARPAPEEDFLSLLLRSMAATGRAAVIVPHGVLFKMGSTYQVRKLLVDHNLIDAVVDLPPNIFYSCKTNVALLVLDKARPHRDVLFVDASAHFEPDRRRNRMRPQHVDALAAVHRNFVPVAGVAARLPVCALQGAPHDYNLAPKRYVQPATAAGPDLYRLRREMDDLHEKLGQVHAQLEDCLKALLQTT